MSREPRPSSPVEGAEPSSGQLEEIRALVCTLAEIDPGTDWRRRCRELSGVPARLLTRGGAHPLVDRLRGELASRVDA